MEHHHNHDHGHNHGHHHFEQVRDGNKKGLMLSLIITAGIMFLEFFGGLFTNSLALLSDSGHMLSDASALLLSLIAIWYASKPPTPKRTYGGYRIEILAALLNGLTLFAIAGIIVYEAIGRFVEPQEVASGTMMIIATVGLLANLLSALFLTRFGDVEGNVNLKGAYLHILGDALGSIGAIIAGLFMLLFDWYIADPIISVVVALMILKSAWGVVKHSIHILMEGTPHRIDPEKVKAELLAIEGVMDVHDLHIWTITSGRDSLSCHIVVNEEVNCQKVLQQAINQLKDHFHIEHTTIQTEIPSIHHDQMDCH